VGNVIEKISFTRNLFRNSPTHIPGMNVEADLPFSALLISTSLGTELVHVVGVDIFHRNSLHIFIVNGLVFLFK